jgi:hypothetical protein
MATLRKQIVDALVLALNTARPSGLPEATRLRQSQNEREAQPAISVYPGEETIKPATNRASPVVSRSLQVVVEARAAGDEPDVLLDPLLAWIETSVTRAASPLWHDAPQARLVTHEYAIGAIPHGLAKVTFLIEYQTRRTSPEAAD